MALGTAPARVVDLLQSEWQVSRVGRGDVPDVVRDSNGDPSSDPQDTDVNADPAERVLILHDREEVSVNHAVNDEIHVYQPDADPPVRTDRGFKEQRISETVQIDIVLTDYTDNTVSPPERLSARARMVGDRGDLASFSDPPYGGIAGEVQYILETVRRGLDEWDRVDFDYAGWTLKNSDATVRVRAELTQLAANTVQ